MGRKCFVSLDIYACLFPGPPRLRSGSLPAAEVKVSVFCGGHSSLAMAKNALCIMMRRMNAVVPATGKQRPASSSDHMDPWRGGPRL